MNSGPSYAEAVITAYRCERSRECHRVDQFRLLIESWAVAGGRADDGQQVTRTPLRQAALLSVSQSDLPLLNGFGTLHYFLRLYWSLEQFFGVLLG